MTNQHSRKPLNLDEIVRRYRGGDSLVRIALDLGVNKRRIKQALLDAGVSVRRSTDHSTGNSYALQTDISRDELLRLYVEERMSIRAIERTTGTANIRYHLLKHGVPLRGAAEHRIGKGDPLTPESRAKVTSASLGPNNRNWKGGITAAFRKFYASLVWKRLARACKERDGLTCQSCFRSLPANQLRAHHVVPREDGGSDTLDNLLTLCNPCHRRAHNIASRAAVMRPDAGPETALASRLL